LSIGKNTNPILHKIKARLFPTNLPDAKDVYYARASNEALLSVEQIAAALKNRGGATDNYNDIVKHVKQFMDEAAYQLCDGFAVNLGYFSIHPGIGGFFKSGKEGYSAKEHPLGFRFRTRDPMRDLTRYISIEIEAEELSGSFIDSFTDIDTGAVNEAATPGGLFVMK
jgi:hypothetical protein